MIRARVLQVAPATLLVHASTSLCALAGAVPIASSVPSGALEDTPVVGAIYTTVRLFDAAFGHPLKYGTLPLLALCALTPFLRVLWLSSQLSAAPLTGHAQLARRVYKPALAVYAACGGYTLALALAGWLAANVGAFALSFSHDERLQQCLGLTLALPFAIAALIHAPTVSDLAFAALARTHGELQPQAALREAVLKADLRVCSARAGAELLLLAVLASCLLPRLWLGAGVGASWIALGLGQLAAVAQTLVRALWYAWLVQRSQPAPAAPESAPEPIQLAT